MYISSHSPEEDNDMIICTLKIISVVVILVYFVFFDDCKEQNVSESNSDIHEQQKIERNEIEYLKF